MYFTDKNIHFDGKKFVGFPIAKSVGCGDTQSLFSNGPLYWQGGIR